MGGAVYAGLYSLYGKHVFTDYSYTNYDGNEAGVDAEIAKYAYTVNIPVTAAYKGGYVTADKIAIAKNATDRQVKLTFVSRSGYRLTDVKNNGVSIFEALKATSEGNTATISDIEGNIAITADFTEIPAENKASLHGGLRGTDRSEAERTARSSTRRRSRFRRSTAKTIPYRFTTSKELRPPARSTG